MPVEATSRPNRERCNRYPPMSFVAGTGFRDRAKTSTSKPSRPVPRGKCVHHVLCAAGTVGYGGLEEVEDSQMTNEALSAGNNKFIVLNRIQSLLGPANENLSVLGRTGAAL